MIPVLSQVSNCLLTAAERKSDRTPAAQERSSNSRAPHSLCVTSRRFCQQSAERDLSLILRRSIDLLLKDAWVKSDEFWSDLNLFSEHEGVAAIAKFRRSDEGPRAEKLPPLPRRSRSRDVASLTSAPRPTR